MGVDALKKTVSTQTQLAVGADPIVQKKSSEPPLDQVGGKKQPPIGGAQRPPANAVELPTLGGRPKVETTESVFKQIDGAFASAKPESLEAAIGLLGTLGFHVDRAKGDHAKLVRGDFKLRIEDETFGSNFAFRLELDGPKGVDKSGVAISGATLSEPLFKTMRDKYRDVVETFEAALDANGKKPLPTTFDALKTFIEGAKSEKAKAKDALEDAQVGAKIDALVAKLEDMKAQGDAPKKVIIYTDGPDGAGKSSTGAIVMQALSKVGYTADVAIFKAPTAEEREQHWLQRFKDKGVPNDEDVARFWDRGPAGDAVYGKKSPTDVKKMAKELLAFEKELAQEGVLLFKAHIFADPEKQAETFGKRLARQEAANVIEAKLKSQGKLTDATKDALDNIRNRIDGDDFRALTTFDDVQAGFLKFSKLTGYNVVDATDRHAARLQIIDALQAQLEKL